jgi:hypothetical protein
MTFDWIMFKEMAVGTFSGQKDKGTPMRLKSSNRFLSNLNLSNLT